MKRIGSIVVVVVLLLGAAIFYSKSKGNDGPTKVTDGTDVEVVSPDREDKDGDGDARPVTRGRIDGTLAMDAAISHGWLSSGSTSDMYVSIDVTAREYDGAVRPPLNLALVIDRSGSMGDEKIYNAKNAARRLVRMLGARDRLAIISYGSDVSTEYASRPVTAENRAQMIAAIERIEVNGGTNLSGGYQRGLGEVLRWKSDDSVNRVLLMSDGNANVGITSIDELEKLSRDGLHKSVTLTSMGVGLDYNEDLMTRMANEGAGNYYFIDKPTSTAQIFAKEMEGLTNVVARNASLTITMADGVDMVELYGLPHERRGNKILVSMSEFFSEQNKSLFIKFIKMRVPAGSEGARPIVDIDLSYEDITSDKQAHGAVALRSVVTGEADKLAEVDQEVISRFQQIEIANSMQDAMELYGKGQQKEAARRIARQRTRTRKLRRKYKIDDTKFDRVDREMQSAEDGIRSAEPSSTSGRRMIKKNKSRSNAIIMDSVKF